MLKFQPRQKTEPKQQEMWYSPIPVDVMWGIYARQSTPAQLIKNAESTEMQTDDLIEWLIAKGIQEKHWQLFDADLGVSGTLRIDQRTGLQELVERIQADEIKAVLVYQISRLFRDDTGVEYNTFATICKQHNCVLVTADGMVFDFNNRMHVKMFRFLAEYAAEFIPQQIGLLHAARLRRAQKGFYAGLGAVPSGFMVDKDKANPTYKKLIPLPTHKPIVVSLFKRFYEIGAENKIQFFRELDEQPYIFPEFDTSVDQATRGSNRRRKVPGGYHMSRYAIERMLCNPVNIGWWIVQGDIISTNNHEPLLKPEEQYLFWYAFESLSPYTTEGEVNTHRVLPNRRYIQRKKRGKAGLLKYRINTPGGKVYTHWNKNHCSYNISQFPSRVMRKSDTEIEVSLIDGAFVTLLFSKLESTHDFDGYRAWLSAEAKRQTESQGVVIVQLAELELRLESIQDEKLAIRVEVKQAKLSEKEAPPMLARLREKEGKLETLKTQLTEKVQQGQAGGQRKGKSPQAALRTYDEFHVELHKLKQVWHKKPFEKRQNFINTLVQKAVLIMESPHWLRLEIHWGYPVWTPDTIYLYRPRGKTPFWTDEEKAIVIDHYPKAKAAMLLQLLPNKSWSSIRSVAMQLGVKREVFGKNTLPIPIHETWGDYLFSQQRVKEECRLKCQVEESVNTE